MKVLQSGFWLLLATLTLTSITASPLGYCHDKADGSVYPIAGTCTTYIYCLHENAIVLTCPFGEGFSPAARGCLTKAKSDCAQTTTLPFDGVINTTLGSCLDNEQRPENKVACMGQPFGELMPYPGDCSRFLVCNCEYPTVKNCSAGLWFNNAAKVCDWPQNVNCSNVITPPIECTPPAGISASVCDQSKDGTLIRYPYNCNAYVNCTVGCPVLKYCDTGKVFNDMLKICDTPDTATCEDEPIPTTTPSSTNEPTTTTEDPTTPHVCAEPPFGVENYFCTHQPEGSFHNYPYNCTAYIECRGGCAKLDYCEPGKIFNNILNICDTPNSVVCYEIPYPGSSTTTTETPVTDSPTTNPNLPPLINPTSCVNRPDHTLVPYPDNCAQYIECMNNGNIVHTCPDGSVFNPNLLICDQASHDSCYGISTDVPTVTAATPSLPPVVFEKCLNSPKGTTYPYSSDCHLYYYCWGNNTSTLLSCPNNNYYNPQTGNCGPEVSATACQESATTIAPTINPETVCESQPTGSTFPVTGNCAQYIMCVGGASSVTLNCPNNNYYNPNTGNCGPDVSPTACQQTRKVSPTPTSSSTHKSASKILSTTVTANICENVPNFSIVPDSQNCSQFIVCMNKDPMFVQCSEGEYFDPSIGNCDSTATSKTCTNWKYTPSPTPPTSAPTLQGICGNHTQSELLAYPGNCTKYIICVKPEPVAFSCPKNWYFNAAMRQCNLPTDANCTETSVTTPPNGGKTTASPITDDCNGVSNGTTFPYTNNCQMFIRCTGNNFYLYDICNNQEYYDPAKGECSADVSTNACNADSSTPTEPPEMTGVCAGQTSGSKIPYPNNCSKYIVCVLPIPIGYDCGEDLEFNSELQECTNPENANCGSSGGVIGGTTTTTTESTVVTSAPKTCADLPNASTLPYPEDCSKYIVCLNGQSMLVQCDANSYYNVHTGSCDQQTSATACRESDQTTTSFHTTESTFEPSTESTTFTTAPKTCADLPNDSTLPYPDDCSQYYVCLNGQAMLVQCIPNQYYNVHTGNCDGQTSATACKNTDTTTTTEGTSTSMLTTATDFTTEIVTTTTQSTTRLEPTTTEEATTITSAPKTCTGLSNGATLPYPTDCSKYITCINGQEMLTDCMPKQYYNDQTGNCDSQTSETACKNSGTTTTGTTSSPETSTTKTDDTTKSETTSSTVTNSDTTTTQSINEKCLGQPVGTTFPNTEDCSLYYYCWGNNTSTLLSCPNNNYYNPQTGRCGPEVSSIACQGTTHSASTIETTTEFAGTTDVSTVSSGTYTTEEFTTITSAPKSCANLSNGATLPYPTDCSKYIVCINGQEMVTECMPNQYYNIQKGNCDGQTSETACRNSDTTTPLATHTPELTTTTQSESTHSDSTTLSTTEIIATTVSSGTYTTEEFTMITSAPKPCANLPNGATLPYPTDCSKYIVCINGQEMVTECMPNQYYNVKSGNCDSQTSETACRNSDTTTPGVTHTPEFPTTTQSETTHSDSTTLSTTDVSTVSSGTYTTEEFTTITSAPKTCANLSNGATLPYPTDCSKYIVCINGQEMVTECMPNQYYNIQKGNCDSQTSETACRNSDTTTPGVTHTPELPTTTQSEATHSDSTTLSTTDASTVSSGTYTTEEFTTITSAPKTCANLSNGATLPYPTDCSKYIVCINGQEMVTECIPNEYYNIQMGNCDSQTSETACRNSDTTTPGVTHRPELTTPTVSETTHSDKTTLSTTEIAPTTNESTVHSETSTTEELTTITSSPKTCAGLSDGATLPYQSDCSKYIVCVNGHEMVTACMPNQYYNIQTGNCDSQTSETACRNSDTTTPGTTLATVTENTTEEITTPTKGTTHKDTSTTIDDITTLTPNACVDLPNDSTLSYPTDCSKYIKCLNGQEVLVPCVPDTYYNIQTGKCDAETSETACRNSATTTGPTNIPESSTSERDQTTAIPDISTTNDASTESTTQQPFYEKCLDQPIGATFSYIEDCHLYYYCWGNNTSSLLSCPFNNYYNPITGRCGPEVSSTACQEIVLTTTPADRTEITTDNTAPTTAPKTCANLPDGATLPYPEDCSKYEVCLNGQEMLVLCKANTYYNVQTGMCDAQTSTTACRDVLTTTPADRTEITTDNTAPTTAPKSCANLPDGATLPYPEDCSKYEVCLNGKGILVLCKANTYYNVQTSSCDAQTSTTACRDFITTIRTDYDSTTEINYVSTTTSADDKTTATNMVTDETTSTVTPIDCADKPNGTSLPYFYDCSKYIICLNGKVNMAQCIPNTFYNIQTGKCERQISNTSCHDITTSTVSTNTATTISEESTSSTKGITSTAAPNSCTGITNGKTLPYLDDCSEYIICWNDHEILTKCTPKTFYNTLTGDCDAQISNTFCRDSSTTTKTTHSIDETTSSPEVTKYTEQDNTTIGKVTATFDLSSSTFAMTTNSPEATITSTAGSTTTTTPNSCTGLESGTTLPYISDCSLYIFCFKNKEIIALCMPDTYYDLYSGYCDKQSTDSSCREITTTTISTETASVTSTSKSQETTINEYSTISTTTSKETTTFLVSSTPAVTTYTSNTTTDYTSSSVAPNSCTDVPNGTSLPYLSDCSKYIICWNNQVILTECMPKTYFNILTGNCDVQSSKTSCRDSITTTISSQNTEVTTSSPEVTMNTNHLETTTTSTDFSTSTTKPNSCTDLESGITLPYLSDCSKYVFCLNNKEIVALCMPDTYYDVYTGNCNQKTSDTACRDSKTTTDITSVTTPNSERTSTTKEYDTTLAETSTPVTLETTKSSTDDTSTSAAPNSCTGVPNGTSLPYRSDCSKYIICWNNQVILTKCLPETYFNILTGDCDAKTSNMSCRESVTTTTSSQETDGTTSSPEGTMYTNHPEKTTTTTTDDSTVTVKPNSCTGLESGITLPYLNDCSLYIFCFKSREILAICPTNTYYDIYTGNCNQHTSNSACREETTTEIYGKTTTSTTKTFSEQTSTSTILDETSTIPTTIVTALTAKGTETTDLFTSTTTVTTSTDDTSSSAAPSSCTGVPNGTSLPYPKDCAKYIICWNNQVILTQCFPNTFYNIQTETCNKQTSNTACRDTTTTTSTTQTMNTPTRDTSDTTIEPPFTTAAITETTSSVDPCYDKPAGYQVPYPNNCSKYIICNDPLPVGHDCPDNLEFNANIQECVLPDLANCNMKTITTTVDPTSTTTDSKFTTMTTFDPMSTSTDLHLTTIDPTDTTLDPTLSTIAINICLNIQNGIRFPYGNNCSGFVYCENGAERYELCQSGYYYNPSLDACDNNVSPEVCLDFEMTTTTLPATTTFDPTESTSTTRNPHTPNVCCGKPLNTRVIYPDDCSRYITCAYPVPIVGQCPINTSFDTGTLQCISSNLAQCRASTGQSAVKITTTTPTAVKPTTSTPTNIILQGECSYLPSGSQLVFIGDCTKYNFCFGGQSYVLSCSANFYFNPNRKQCVPTNSYKCPW